MGKKLKSIGLVLFSICCAIGFSTKVNAETIVLEEDTKASDITLSDGLVIDGQGKYTITGQLTISNGENITIKNVTMDGEDGSNLIMLYLTNAGDVVVDNVNFVDYGKTGIYAVYMSSLSVTNSTFDALQTYDLVDQEITGDEADEIRRSAAGIDLNLGNNEITYSQDKDYNVDSITIKNNTFKNVVVADENKPTSTAGAIKIKLKGASNLGTIGKVLIESNTFENNWQDLVIGTNSTLGENSRESTGDLEILLMNNEPQNGVLAVKDNSTEETGLSGGYIGNFKINGTLDYALSIDDNYYFIISNNNVSSVDDSVMKNVMNDSDIKGISYNVDGLTFAFSKETLTDENIGAALDEFNIVPSETTTIEDLKKYEGEEVAFFTVTGIELLEDGITYDISSLGEEYAGTLYLYYYDETNGLQLVANPEDAILTFDKNGTYVLSAENLIPSTPSEEVPETPSEDVPEVPQTFDSLGMYAGFGIIGALGITGAVLYLKRRA